MLEESFEKELDFDDEPSNLPEVNYHITENPIIEKILEEGSRNKEKSKKKRKRNWQRKKQGRNQTSWHWIWMGKNKLHMKWSNVVWKLALSISFQIITSLLTYFLLKKILIRLSKFLLMKVICMPRKMGFHINKQQKRGFLGNQLRNVY